MGYIAWRCARVPFGRMRSLRVTNPALRVAHVTVRHDDVVLLHFIVPPAVYDAVQECWIESRHYWKMDYLGPVIVDDIIVTADTYVGVQVEGMSA